jgi:hypothetical protein
MGRVQWGGRAVWAQGLLERVERWREVRRKGSAMPGELWEAAAELAAEHGVYAVSRQLRLSYESLRRRVGRETGRRLRDEAGGGFVEVRAAQLLGSAAERAVPVAGGAEVEVWGSGGARLWVRLEDGGGVDVAGVVSAFLSSRG